MRLVPTGHESFEVQYQSRAIGRVWRFKGLWRGETKKGTPVRAVDPELMTAYDMGLAVEDLYRAGS